MAYRLTHLHRDFMIVKLCGGKIDRFLISEHINKCFILFELYRIIISCIIEVLFVRFYIEFHIRKNVCIVRVFSDLTWRDH